MDAAASLSDMLSVWSAKVQYLENFQTGEQLQGAHLQLLSVLLLLHGQLLGQPTLQLTAQRAQRLRVACLGLPRSTQLSRQPFYLQYW